MSRTTPPVAYAERVLEGLDDSGDVERIVLSIDWREGGVWVVERRVDDGRGNGRDEELFAGYELDDALQHANEALEDDVRMLEAEGQEAHVTPFTRQEILPMLERWFLHGSS